MRQRLIPNPGKIAVVREAVSKMLRHGSLELEKPDSSVDDERRASPFAMVVGVGDPEITDYGTTIKTDLKEGDKVVCAQIGMNVPLTVDGITDYVYVLPFGGVVGRIEAVCDGCGHVEREKVAESACPSCGADSRTSLVAATPDEVATISKARIDGKRRRA